MYNLDRNNFYIVRNLFSLTIILFYFKLVKISFVFQKIGPIFIMIQRMIKDVFYISLIMLIFLISYGIISQSLFYSISNVDWFVIKNILY